MEYDIRMDPDTVETMNTPQPDTISIDGVEVPSWQKVWRESMVIRQQIATHRRIMAIQGTAIFLIALMQLL